VLFIAPLRSHPYLSRVFRQNDSFVRLATDRLPQISRTIEPPGTMQKGAAKQGRSKTAPLHAKRYRLPMELVIAASTEPGATPRVTMAAINSTHRRRVDQSSTSGMGVMSFSPNTAWRTTCR